MKFTHQGKRITLHGQQQGVNHCPANSVARLQRLLNQQNITCCIQMKMCEASQGLDGVDQELHSITISADLNVPWDLKQILDAYSKLF